MLKIALLPGHNGKSTEGDLGCVWPGTSINEFDIVKKVVSNIWSDLISEPRARVYLIHRGIEPGSYSKLPDELNDVDPDIIIEVHLNASSNRDVQGFETLYWGTSKRGKELATIVQNHLAEAMLGYKNRGLKPLTTDDRGANLLRKTKAPAIIVEGFFLTGCKDTEQLNRFTIKYCKALRSAILEMINKYSK